MNPQQINQKIVKNYGNFWMEKRRVIDESVDRVEERRRTKSYVLGLWPMASVPFSACGFCKANREELQSLFSDSEGFPCHQTPILQSIHRRPSLFRRRCHHSPAKAKGEIRVFHSLPAVRIIKRNGDNDHHITVLTPMARALSNMLFKGFRSMEYSRTTASASGSFLQHGLRFSTSVPNDPDTHDDFKPTNKLENSDITLKDIVEQDVKDNHVMIYMKGDPEQPRCGFSSLAVRVLSEYRVPIHSRNILEDPELKNAVKAFSMWPTFPQIFINGEFIGGSDIILNMHQNGELKEKLKATSSE